MDRISILALDARDDAEAVRRPEVANPEAEILGRTDQRERERNQRGAHDDERDAAPDARLRGTIARRNAFWRAYAHPRRRARCDVVNLVAFDVEQHAPRRSVS